MPAAFLTQKDKNKSKNEQECIYVVKEEREQYYKNTQLKNRQHCVSAHQERKRKKENAVQKDERKVKSRLGELLLAEKRKETNTKSELEKQTDPEVCTGESILPINREVREYIARTGCIWCSSSRQDRSDGTNDLGSHKSKGDVETSKRLQENHTKANALD
jgi:hypothetical protein